MALQKAGPTLCMSRLRGRVQNHHAQSVIVGIQPPQLMSTASVIDSAQLMANKGHCWTATAFVLDSAPL